MDVMEAVVAWRDVRYYPEICLEKLRNITKA
jgi:hypothetical protein